ncbi:MAG: outer membrane beta-barrel protein [bacterium]
MQKTLSLLAILLFVLVSPAILNAQVTIQVGAGAGIGMPAGDYKGATTEYYAGNNYGMGNGINFHAKARLGLIGFRLTGEVDYTSYSNSGDAEAGKGTLDVKHKILAFRVGPEFHLSLPLVPVTPYLGANVALNTFSGETSFQGVARVPSQTFTMESASRIGVGFSGGVILKAGLFMTLDLNASYHLMNISGKEWKDINPITDQRLDTYLALNDEQDPQYKSGDVNHVIGNARSINAMQFRATLMFGL